MIRRQGGKWERTGRNRWGVRSKDGFIEIEGQKGPYNLYTVTNRSDKNSRPRWRVGRTGSAYYASQKHGDRPPGMLWGQGDEGLEPWERGEGLDSRVPWRAAILAGLILLALLALVLGPVLL